MFRATRSAIAAILALAIAALPVVLDRCAESCEAHQNTVASTPACHHAASTGTHISHVPSPCGRDHNETAVTAANNAARAGRAFDSVVLVDAQPTVEPPTAADLRVQRHSPPNSSPTLDRRSLPLRV
jgi:hypothetical protein